MFQCQTHWTEDCLAIKVFLNLKTRRNHTMHHLQALKNVSMKCLITQKKLSEGRVGILLTTFVIFFWKRNHTHSHLRLHSLLRSAASRTQGTYLK